MQKWTLFVDESGLFEHDRNRVFPRGLRLVGGVLVPQDIHTAEHAAALAISHGLTHSNADWWTGPIHATEFLYPPNLAGALRRQPAVPDNLAILADEVSETSDKGNCQRRRLLNWGDEVLWAIRLAIGKFVVQHQGIVVGVAEYGDKIGRNGMLARSRYAPMLHALVKTCLLKAASIASESIGLTAVVASRPNEKIQFQQEPWIRSIKALLHHGGSASGGSFDAIFKRADDMYGLQLADVIVHALGPGRGFGQMPNADEIRARTMFNMKITADELLGCGRTAYEEYDALDAHQCLKNAVERSGTRTSLLAARDELSRLAVQRPLGIFPSAVQQTINTIDSLDVKR